MIAVLAEMKLRAEQPQTPFDADVAPNWALT
jgi:hypothetical protein